VARVFCVCQTRLKLSRNVNECKPLLPGKSRLPRTSGSAANPYTAAEEGELSALMSFVAEARGSFDINAPDHTGILFFNSPSHSHSRHSWTALLYETRGTVFRTSERVYVSPGAHFPGIRRLEEVLFGRAGGLVRATAPRSTAPPINALV